MDALRDFLNQNWIGTLIGLCGTIIGIVLAFAFAPRPRLAAQVNTLELVGPNAVLPHEIEFFFQGKKVPQVTLSKIAVWNIGNKTIQGHQIVNSDPVRIVISEGSVLETVILHRTRAVNDFACVLRSGSDNQIECRFDYLDVGDGALIQVIHTGNDKVDVLGSLREIPKGIRIVGNPYHEKSRKKDKISQAQAQLLSLVSTVIGLTSAAVAISGIVIPNEDWPPIAGIGVLFTIAGMLLYWGISLMPPGELSTQITSNEPKKSMLQALIGKMKSGHS
jgi:hypothetical protein